MPPPQVDEWLMQHSADVESGKYKAPVPTQEAVRLGRSVFSGTTKIVDEAFMP